jgi:hypothetical protein
MQMHSGHGAPQKSIRMQNSLMKDLYHMLNIMEYRFYFVQNQWTYSELFWLLCFVVEDLRKMPAPEVAVKYYTEGDLYLFGKFLCNKLQLHHI